MAATAERMSAPVTPRPVTTAEVVAVHERLTRWVYANFKRKLDFDEAGDCAAQALFEADRATGRGTVIRDLDGWLRVAAWRNALSALRRVEGEGKVVRARPDDVTSYVEVLLDDYRFENEILDDAARRDDTDALTRAWGRLKPDEQRALHLRYFDEVPVDQVLELLGCSRHQYENLTKRGLRKLRDALLQTTADEACARARDLTLQAAEAPLSTALRNERDAHVASCLACRAFDRRRRGLMAALPLPAVGLLDRANARLHGLLNGSPPPDPATTADGVAGATALASSAAAGTAGLLTGGGGAAAGLAGAAGTAKAIAVVCAVGSVTAGVCTTTNVTDDRPDRAPARVQQAATKKPPPPAPEVTAVAPRPPTPDTPAPARQMPASSPSMTPAGQAEPRATDTESDSEASPDPSPFLPESAAPARDDPRPGPDATAARTEFFSSPDPGPTAAPSNAAPVAAAPSQPRPRETPPASSGSFSEEFGP